MSTTAYVSADRQEAWTVVVHWFMVISLIEILRSILFIEHFECETSSSSSSS
jgi:hypothetical protein